MARNVEDRDCSRDFRRETRPSWELSERPFALNSREIKVVVFCPCAEDLRKGELKESGVTYLGEGILR